MPVSAITSDLSNQINSVNNRINNLDQPWAASDRFTASKGWEINHLQCSKIGPWVLLTAEMRRTETWTCKAWEKSVMLTMPDWLGAVNDTTMPAASNGSANQGGNFYVNVSRTTVNAFPAMSMSLNSGRWVAFSVCWFAAK